MEKCAFLQHVSYLDQYLILGAEEGIYTLNLNELHEDTLERVSKECIYVLTGILLQHNTLQSKNVTFFVS